MARKQQTKADRIIGSVVVLGIVGLIIFGIVKATNKPDAPALPYTATVDAHYIDPSTIEVTGTVKNTGNAAFGPICSVTVASDSEHYSGHKSFGPFNDLRPAEERSFKEYVTVNDQGATYVTSKQIECYDGK